MSNWLRWTLVTLVLCGCASSPQEMVAQRATQIYERVMSNWALPATAAVGQLALLTAHINRDGTLASIDVTQTSNSEPLDESAAKAIMASAPFLEVATLPDDLYEKNFRSIQFQFVARGSAKPTDVDVTNNATQ